MVLVKALDIEEVGTSHAGDLLPLIRGCARRQRQPDRRANGVNCIDCLGLALRAPPIARAY
jgi:hypothetical protein